MKKVLTGLMVFLLLAGLGACEKADLTEDDSNDKPKTSVVDDPEADDDSSTDNNAGDDDSTKTEGDNTGKVRDGAEVTVAQFLALDGHPMVYVTGYIVGSCQRSLSNADFEPPFAGHTAVLMADSAGEQNTDYMMSVHLKKGNMRDALNLEDHPENFGRRLRVWGTKFTYLGLPGFPEEYVEGYEFVK